MVRQTDTILSTDLNKNCIYSTNKRINHQKYNCTIVIINNIVIKTMSNPQQCSITLNPEIINFNHSLVIMLEKV